MGGGKVCSDLIDYRRFELADFLSTLDNRKHASIYLVLERCTAVGKLTVEEFVTYYLFLQIYFMGTTPLRTKKSVYDAIANELMTQRKNRIAGKSVVSTHRTDLYRTLNILEELGLIVRANIVEDEKKRPGLASVPKRRRTKTMTYQPGDITSVPLQYHSARLDARHAFIELRKTLAPSPRKAILPYERWKEPWNWSVEELELRCNDRLQEIDSSLCLAEFSSKNLTLERYALHIAQMQRRFEEELTSGRLDRALAKVTCGNEQIKSNPQSW